MNNENVVYKVVIVHDLGDCPIMSSHKYFYKREDTEAFINETNQRLDCTAYLVKEEYQD